MKKIIAFFLGLSSMANVVAQTDSLQRAEDEIVAEGKRLYRSEMASWYGTDIFLERFKDREKIGGYFSYEDKEGAKCIFFSKTNHPKVIGTILFVTDYAAANAKTDLKERDFTVVEKEIFLLRNKALSIINNDTFFKKYENTSLNLIPLISNGERKVYVLTGTNKQNVVIFGNDYLLTFDNNNNLVNKRQLHQNILEIKYNESGEEDDPVFGSMHTHQPETGDLMTATDICTLMLYGRFTKWEQHMVISAKYFSVWNCKTNQLVVLTTEAMEKIRKSEKMK